jgi:hypothetical protein
MTLTVGCSMGQSAFGTTSAATCECERTSSRVYPVDPERLLLATRAGTASYLRGVDGVETVGATVCTLSTIPLRCRPQN